MQCLFVLLALSMPLASIAHIGIAKQHAISDVKEQGEDFRVEMFHVVDRIGKNTLARGNMPQQKGVFAYKMLSASLAKTGIKGHFRIMDISLLNPLHEHNELSVETDWFKDNQRLGDIYSHSIHGCIVDPAHLPEAIRLYFLKHHDIDGLKALIPKIRALLKTQGKYPLAVYIHCNAGKDRTGEVCACYQMQYQGHSHQETIALDKQIAGRSIEEKNRNAVKWYTYYLRDILRIHTVGKVD